jgi:hypothetical protein
MKNTCGQWGDVPVPVMAAQKATAGGSWHQPPAVYHLARLDPPAAPASIITRDGC